MAAQTDLWGEIAPEHARTPVVILKEQAALLAKKTQGVIEANVVSSISSNQFVHRFRLTVPALEDYIYELFSISHAASVYPVEAEPHGAILSDEKAFVDWLRDKLSSEETKRIIGNLLAQANS